MSHEVVRPAGMANSQAYSHALKKPGIPVFIAGQVALDAVGQLVGEGDAAAQTEQVLRNLRTVVIACGGSLDDIVKLTVYTTDLAYRPAIGGVRTRFFRAGRMPASTFVVVKSLAEPRFLVEIEAVAMVEA
jgi:enamine deaminase RidA (YjgF/YER057c/UK114 family)